MSRFPVLPSCSDPPDPTPLPKLGKNSGVLASSPHPSSNPPDPTPHLELRQNPGVLAPSLTPCHVPPLDPSSVSELDGGCLAFLPQ